MQQLIHNLPKAELHIHIEGSLEPQMLLDLAKRNRIELKYTTIEQVKQAYKFNNLQDFLDLYYQGMGVLQTEADFYDLTYAYLVKSHSQNVTYAEIFFDPQAHTDRGVAFKSVISGITQAISVAKVQLGIEAKLILSFLRHLPESSAMQILEQALDYRQMFIGVGLDSSELGFPPRLFKNVFRAAKDSGLHLVAHAGEEGPAEYVWEAIDILGVERIDHGNNAINDRQLVARIASDKLALTMCPLSNQRLKSVPNLAQHQLRQFLDAGVIATINSDDPAYFDGYLNENYWAIAQALQLTTEDISLLAQNSFTAAFRSDRYWRPGVKPTVRLTADR